MKKLLFVLLPACALAFTFSFCAKEPALPEVTQQPSTQTAADRGPTLCDISVTSTGNVRVCGLSTNGLACLDCSGVVLSGSDIVAASIIYPQVNTALPVTFSVTNVSANLVNCTVSTVNGAFNFALKPGGCKQFGVQECELVTNVF